MPDRSTQVVAGLTSGVMALIVLAFVLQPGSGRVARGHQALAASPTIPAFALAPAVAASSTDRPPPTPEPGPSSPDAPPVRIAFAGDVHGESPIAEILAAGDNPFTAFNDRLSGPDITVVNLETALGSAGTASDKQFTFRADPRLATVLADSGVDVVTMANNHAMDFGYDGAAETVRIAEAAGLGVVGYGQTSDEAYAPHVIDIGGRSVAVVGLTRVMPTVDWAATDTRPGMASAYDIDAAVAAVQQARQLADHVVVTIHWGRELWVCPDEDQAVLARALAAAGAEVIAGHHAHVLQGVVTIEGAVVAYGLGNFLFYARTPATQQTGVLTVTLGDPDQQQPAVTWSPGTLSGSGAPRPTQSQAPIPEDADVERRSTGPQCGPPA